MSNARNLANIISGGFTADDIPNLDTAKVTTGTFDDARIPSFDASKIATGTIDDARISSAIANQKSAPFRNIIINGDMSIAQRGTSFTGVSTSGTYPVDRFSLFNQTLGTYTLSQDTDVPSNTAFGKSLKVDCTTADASPAAGDYLFLRYVVEGQHLQGFKKGTANAEQFTLSFWVKNTKTGTYTIELEDADNTRTVSKSYTIDASDTWEYKTLTFPADTTGTFDNDANASLRINFGLAMGSDFTSGTLATSWQTRTNADRHVGISNFADSTSNNFLMTGVQLEVGTTASDFEFLPYDVNLQRCQRYYQKFGSDVSGDFPLGRISNSSNFGIFSKILPIKMRTSPTGTITVGDNGGAYVSRAVSESTEQSVASDATEATYADLGTLTLTAEL